MLVVPGIRGDVGKLFLSVNIFFGPIEAGPSLYLHRNIDTGVRDKQCAYSFVGPLS